MCGNARTDGTDLGIEVREVTRLQKGASLVADLNSIILVLTSQVPLYHERFAESFSVDSSPLMFA